MTTQTEPGYLVTLSDGRQVFIPVLRTISGESGHIGNSFEALAYAVGYEHGQGRNVTAVSAEWVKAGQRQCAHCGVFIEDDLEDILCGNCSAIYKQEMLLEERRAEWHAECRRDVFGI